VERASLFRKPDALEILDGLDNLDDTFVDAREGAAAVDAEAAGREETLVLATGTVLGHHDMIHRNASSD